MSGSSDEHAPRLETVQSILDNQTLPLLVQRRSGDTLLLNKFVRIPYVVCQKLDHPQSKKDHTKQGAEEYFLIPLNNKGFYGAVSAHDEPTLPYTSLSQILLQHKTSTTDLSLANQFTSNDRLTQADRSGSKTNISEQDRYVEVLCDNVTPIREFDKDYKKFIHKVLLPGDTIAIPTHPHSCPQLESKSSRSSGLCCCLRPSSPELSAELTICIRDKNRHIHIDRYIEGRFYIVKHGQVDKMDAGTVYTLSDITRHQGMPRVVCSISPKQTSKDEIPIPQVFRMVSVISDRILVAYTLSDRTQPAPEDQIELSSHNEELFAIAESSRVDMTDIRDHQPIMSVRRAIPGSTISSSDFADILRKSSHLPPKLPSRPPTLRLNPDSLSSKVHTRPSISMYSGGQADIDAYNNEQQRLATQPDVKTTPPKTNPAFIPDVVEAKPIERLRRTEFIDKPGKKSTAVHTVKLPTRDTSSRSILKKFSSVSVRVVKNKNHPSMKTILDNFHNKKDEDTNYGGVPIRRKSKKSLRGLEIVHVLPEAESPNGETDSSAQSMNGMPLSPTNHKPEQLSLANQIPEIIKQSSSCSSEASDDSDDDKRSVEDFIQDQYRFLDNHRDTSSYYSTQTSSQHSSQYSQRSSDVTPSSQRSSNLTTTSSQRSTRTTSSSGDTVGRRQSVRFSAATITVGDSDSETESTVNDSHLTTPTSSRNGFSSPPSVHKLQEPIPDYNQNDRQPMSHLDEIKLRFARSNSGGLKSPNSDKPPPLRRAISETTPKAKVTSPTDPISELKLRFSNIETSDSLTSPSQLSPQSKHSPNSDLEYEDPYLLPVQRPSAKIRIS